MVISRKNRDSRINIQSRNRRRKGKKQANHFTGLKQRDRNSRLCGEDDLRIGGGIGELPNPVQSDLNLTNTNRNWNQIKPPKNVNRIEFWFWLDHGDSELSVWFRGLQASGNNELYHLRFLSFTSYKSIPFSVLDLHLQLIPRRKTRLRTWCFVSLYLFGVKADEKLVYAILLSVWIVNSHTRSKSRWSPLFSIFFL